MKHGSKSYPLMVKEERISSWKQSNRFHFKRLNSQALITEATFLLGGLDIPTDFYTKIQLSFSFKVYIVQAMKKRW